MKGSNPKYCWVEAIACSIAAALISARVLLRPGWPYNHEGLGGFERVEALRRAWLSGDLVPVWSPFASDGYGSPHLLLYHRLFNWVAAALSFVGDSSDIGVRLAIVFFLALGTWGMILFARAALRDLGASPTLSWLAGYLFLLSPYLWTDWLIRGALAEFAAMALVPWFLRELMEVLCSRPRPLALMFVSALLFQAHSILALFAFFAGAVIGFAFCFSPARRNECIKGVVSAGLLRWSLALAVFVIPTVPVILASLRTLPYFNTDFLVQRGYRPEDNLQAIGNYLRHPHFRWGYQYQGFSVEISRWLLIACGVTAIAAWRRRKVWASSEMKAFAAGMLFLVFLQSPWSVFFYRYVPKAGYLQFPWRLLALIIPLLLMSFVRGLAVLRQSSRRQQRLAYTIAAGVMVGAVVVPLNALQLQYKVYSAAEIAELTHHLTGPRSPEYLFKDQVNTFQEAQLHQQLQPHLVELGKCTALGPIPGTFEGKELSFKFHNAESCRIDLRLFPSPMLNFRIQGGRMVEPPNGLGTSIQLDLGNAEILIRKRNLLELAFGTW